MKGCSKLKDRNDHLRVWALTHHGIGIAEKCRPADIE